MIGDGRDARVSGGGGEQREQKRGCQRQDMDFHAGFLRFFAR
jgi:hypothetical protein